jgi:HlyD family secretion protein
MKAIRRRKGIAALAALILVICLGYAAKRRIDASTITLVTAAVERGTVMTTVSGTGVLEPYTTVELKSNVGGQVVYLGVDEGDSVKAGQVIARIDPADSESALEQSRADLDSARSRVTQAQLALTMEKAQYPTQLRSAEQALEAAKARLAQAEEQAKVQPQLTEAAIAQAKSNLTAAKAGYEQAKSVSIPHTLVATQSALDQAKANFAYADKELTRYRGLLEKGFVPRSEVESAQQRADVAKAQLDSAQQAQETVADETRQDLETAQTKVEQAEAAMRTAEANRVQDKLKQDEVTSAKAALSQAEASLQNVRATVHQEAVKQGDITQAQAQVKRAEAAVGNAQTQLGYTTIVAPRSGVVVKKYVEEGSIVAGARTSAIGSGSGVALLEIADVGRMQAIVDVDETDVAQIALGQSVDVTVDAYPKERHTGVVTKIAPQTTTVQNVTTIPVTVELGAPDLRLKPGMNATCTFITAQKSDVLIVPNSAVRESREGTYVMTIKDRKPVDQTVQIGMADDDHTEILAGLKEGDVIVAEMRTPGEQSSARQPSARAGGPGGGPGPGGGGPPPGMRPF